MQRVQAGADLHALCFVDSFPVGKDPSALFHRRPSVREMIFDYEVLAFLCIDERSNVGVAGGDDRLCIGEAVLLEYLFDGTIRPRGDLVDHGPREADFFRVLQIGEEAWLYQLVFFPCRSVGCQGKGKFFAIVGAVVGADHRNRFFACKKSFI